MSWIPPTELGTVIWKGLAFAVSAPQFLTRVVTLATLSVAETLLGLVNQCLITDIRRFKEAFLGKMEAETKAAQADAEKKVAEAADAANKAGLRKRRDAIAKAETDQARAQAAKTAAEAKAILKDAETRRLQAIGEAETKLIEAISKLKQEGGDYLADSKNLQQVLAQTTLSRSTNDLNTSVRVRKCFYRLGITTLGELITRTADELLESKNFGPNSLAEVREKLSQFGLKLRGD